MKRILFALMVLATGLASCTKESIRGSGSTISETRSVSSFTKVRLEGSGDATIVQGPTQEVIITGYQNLVPIYESRVSNGTLILKFQNNYYNIRNNNVRVQITVSNMRGLSINGSGNIHLSNCIDNSIDVEINGSGEINIDNSKFDFAEYRISGSGDIDARNLVAKEVNASISGSGTINTNCTEKLTAHISGSGDIFYWGNPTTVHTQISGSGKVHKR